MVRGAACILCASALAGALGAGTAQAGKDPFAVKVAKHKDGPYKTDTKVSLDDGERASLWFRVNSKLDSVQSLDFNDDFSDNDPDLGVRWFKAGKNVTSEVEGAGYEFTLQPGQAKYFNARVRAKAADLETCLVGGAESATTFDASTVGFNGVSCSI